MKKLIASLAFILCATLGRAQVVDFAYHLTSAANPLNGGPSSTFVGPYSGTPVLGDFIYFNGTNWVSLNKPADGTYSVLFTAGVPSWTAGGGGAPTNATYITQVPEAGLSAEQALSALATGLVKNTTATGVLSIKAANTCTAQFPRSDDASGVWTCAAIANGDVGGITTGLTAVTALPAVTSIGTTGTLAIGGAMSLTSGGTGNVTTNATAFFGWSGRDTLTSPADGQLRVRNNGGSADSSVQGVFFTGPAATTIASAATIAPLQMVTIISGTAAIATITVPSFMLGGCLNFIPSGIYTTTTGGNISLATTAVVGKTQIFCFDGTKWNPSY